MSISEIQEMLARHELFPQRSRGQNFLHDDELAHKLVRRAGVGAGDVVLEIGTGTGVLTRALAARARRVHSVEVDAGLVRALHADGALPSNVTLQQADARKLDLRALCAELVAARDDSRADAREVDTAKPPTHLRACGRGAAKPPTHRAPGGARVVANLPYAAATPLLRALLDAAPLLQSWSVMVQREVAERLTAEPRTRAYTSLSILHQWLATPGALLNLHSRCFYPAPKVVSTFVTWTPRAAPAVSARELPALERVLRAAFAHRRKTLPNALARSHYAAADTRAALEALGFSARARAEELDPEAWRALGRRLLARD